ncbi:type IV pilus biogenesis/stability protein PilW [Sulfuricaulis sp.]|jgi:type IV pilus assembly protein PilF|uniref:type IV pilus biogenesis/stability protein PilW n=1 Tax=Sulfuricaulis sp. TaxID=2003553 RepID=UPI00355AA2C6
MNRRFLDTATILLILALAGCASSAERHEEMEKKDKRAETHVMLGASYMQRGQLDVAKEELEKALSEVPDNSQANNIMAVLQWRLKKYDEADRLFRKALDKDASNSSAHHNYGAFLCDRGKLDAGIRHFDVAAGDALYPYTAEVNLNAGLCLMKKPAPAAAEKYYREALRINPKLPSALYQMAKLSADSGQRLSARGFIERYFQSADDTPESLLLAVKIERALGNKNAEASYALRLRSKFPKSPEAGQLHAASTSKKK